MPSGTAEGDLLIACLVIDGNKSPILTGWTQRHVGWGRRFGTPYVTFGVWWKIASSSEAPSYNITWPTPGETAYGWIMRFTGHDPDPAKTINASVMVEGTAGSSVPPSPAVTSTVAKAMILRLGGFDGFAITQGNPGANLGNAITMDRSGPGGANMDCSGGAAWTTAEYSGASNFQLTGSSSEEYVTVTIAIAPETAE
jgi:hypothetical protein